MMKSFAHDLRSDRPTASGVTSKWTFVRPHLYAAAVAKAVAGSNSAANNLTSLPSFVTTLSAMVDLNIGLWI